MPEDTLTITDNRTGREYTLPIVDGTIHATDLRQLSAADGDGGLQSYDPAYLNTASCRSTITYIDGDAGILRYRGYPIEQLAEEAGFLETAYLLLEGELPTAAELAAFEEEVRIHTYVHTNVQKFLEGFRYDAHPMGMLVSAVAAHAHCPVVVPLRIIRAWPPVTGLWEQTPMVTGVVTGPERRPFDGMVTVVRDTFPDLHVVRGRPHHTDAG